ncbi:MAG: hypothetical protein H6626_15105 [Pseudobdellovibrionaceae bacterium]|nr:hypothetical protein [Bdellovibrionales bacterium]USN47481.1 MAG: hypothetical protein H6626_15105 [Pseudobdellovibrionaceae bacterium]
MKLRAMAMGLAFFSLIGAAHAGEMSWQEKLENYREEIKGRSIRNLYFFDLTYQSAKISATCTASTAVVGATFVSESMPVFGVISEGIASITSSEYEVFDAESFLSLETAAGVGRGALGGAVVGTAEVFEFLLLWLAGEEDQSFKALKKVYGGTVATAEALFAEQSQCLMSFSKLILVLKEIDSRETDPRNLYFTDEEIMP